ncbi:MAG TPA: regulatory protein RecX [Terriglobales bacterium]|nr:regulatory protein RecX [Terriglobales bacterium]
MTFRRRQSYDAPALYEYAVGALGRKMRSVAELKRLLRQRVAGAEDAEVLVEAVILKLKEQRYLNDAQYAAAYSSYRKENEKFGKRRVITGLKAKGVHAEVIEKAVKEAYAGVNEETLARAFLARKRVKKPKDGREAARTFRTLLRAGFGTRTALAILKKWEVEEEVLSALEGEPMQNEE